MMNTEEAWSGTASDLHEKLSEQVGDTEPNHGLRVRERSLVG